jgi:hypothetical protein
MIVAAPARHFGSEPRLVIAAIVYWNTLYIGRVAEHLRPQGKLVPDELLTHVAPLGWRHIGLTGDYLWQRRTSMMSLVTPSAPRGLLLLQGGHNQVCS